MPYFTREDILTKISDQDIIAMLDDNGDGQEDAGLLDDIIAVASNAADAYVASIYTTPFTTYIPAKIKDSGIIFACEMLYQRRLAPTEQNIFRAQANLWRMLLADIGAGRVPLDANVSRAVTPGFAIVQTTVLSVDNQGDPIPMY